jgi:hypothetical protein
VAAIGALEPGEAGGEVAAAEEGFDGGDGGRVERAEILAVPFFVVGEEFFPTVVDELPEGRGAGAAGLVNGGHKECSEEHLLCGARMGVIDRFGGKSGIG